MAITTLTKVKRLLNKADTDSDAWIDALIPQVESDYKHIRGKPFDEGTKLKFESSGLPADEKMTLTIGNYASVGGTAAGLEYDIVLRKDDTADRIAWRTMAKIQPSLYYGLKLGSASTSEAEVYFVEQYPSRLESYSVLDLSATHSTSITSTVSKRETIYPDGAEMTAAQMIGYQMNKPGGVKSESLGDYSVTYDDASGGYPNSITGQIQRYARML